MVAELRELESDHADRIWSVYGMSCQKFSARKTGIAQPNICKWQQDEAKYIAAAGDDLKKGLVTKGTERRWFRAAEHALHSKLMNRRKRKLRVSTSWIRVNAKKLVVLEKYPDHPHARSFAASERWGRKFAKRHHLSKRRRRNMTNKSVEERLPQMMRFHRRLHRLLQQQHVRRPAAEGAAESDSAEVLPMQNPVYGRFNLDWRINVDHVGLAFVNGLESTWDETGTKRVQISQSFAGLEKRQCAVNACFGPGAKRSHFPRQRQGPGGGKGGVRPPRLVLFQKNAWMDNATSIAWLKKSLLRSLKGEEGVVPRDQSILFADNL